MEITKELVEKVRDWLGEDGRIFFTECLKKYGSIAKSIWMEGSIPHPVHFREGMKVRNFIRSTGLCNNWNAIELDDNYEEVVRRALSVDI